MNKKLYFNLVFFVLGTFVVLTMGTIIGINFVKDSRLLARPVMAQDSGNQAQGPQPTPVKAKKNEETKIEGSNGTYVYKRSPDPVKSTPKPTVSPTPQGTATPGLQTPVPTPTPNTTPGGTATPGGTTKPGTTTTPGGTTTPGATPTPGTTTTPGGTTTPGTTTNPSPTAPPKSLVSGQVKVEVVNRSSQKDLAEKVRQKLENAGFEVSAGNDPSISAVRTEIILRKENPEAQKVSGVVKASKVSTQLDPNSRYDVTIIIGDDYAQ